MKKIGLLMIIVFWVYVYAFRGVAGFEEQVVKNFNSYVRCPHEKVYLHTDKSAYVVGENVWFRAYGVHGLVNIPEILSRFVYVDLVDKRDSLVRRVKVGLRDSCFYGQLALPEDLAQGEYCLRAYTYNLQNLGSEYLFKKKIRVVNPHDSKVKTDVSYRKNENGYVAEIKFTDGNGDPYGRVPVLCNIGEMKLGVPGKKMYTNERGVLEMEVDSAGQVINVAFANGKPFVFERYIRVPVLQNDFDVQFFPEGGTLLVGNRQQVAFKAVGADGHPVEVTGTVYQDSVPLFEMQSVHDGMGSFMLPVNWGRKFQVVVKNEDGIEKSFDLPESRLDGWGMAVTKEEGNMVDYLVMRGEDAVLPGELYVLVHSRGVVFDIRPVTGKTRGRIDRNLLPEGIAQVVLMDGAGKVYSQRLFFVRHDERPELRVKANQRNYVARELVELEIGFEEGGQEGVFSLSVTDDQKVFTDSLEDNIMSNLLLTSELKGYIEHPAYYFNEWTEETEHHLDLVMQTHGWTRFDPGKLASGEFPNEKHEVEVAQMVSGQVKNYWGNKSVGANIILLSNYGQYYMTETDEEGNFTVDNILFNDSTRFIVQAMSAKGRQRVEVAVREDELIAPVYDLPDTEMEKRKEEEFLDKFGLNYYYENGEKVYVLEEVNVNRRKRNKTYSFYDNLAERQLDSVKLAMYAERNDVLQVLLAEVPGISFTKDTTGDVVLMNGRPMRVVVNEMEADMMLVKSIPVKMLLNIAVIGQERARVLLGDSGSGGILAITAKPGYWMGSSRERLNLVSFKLLGYQEPEEFYVPRYDVDSVRRDSRYDERTTIYWNPMVKVKRGETTKVSFYTADTYGTYSVTVEGVTRDGVVCRKRGSLVLK